MELLCNLVAGNEKLVLGSLFTLFGVLVAGIINFLLKRLELSHARKMKKIEFASSFKQENLFKPVVSFLESDLIALQAVYGLLFVEKKDRREVKINNDHLVMLSSIEARIKALTDSATYEKFNEYSRKRLRIGNALENIELDPYVELKSAIELASNIMKTLYEQATDIEIKTTH